MKPVLTFIIPVRHQDNAKDWNKLKSNLTQTLRSMSAQDDKRWKAIIVANNGADLPELPPQVEVKRVDFSPNQTHDKGSTERREDWWDAFRIDKGRRVLAGLYHAGKDAGHIMITDDDDLVSRRLTSFVAQHPSSPGWFIKKGYVWSDGGKYLYEYEDFSRLCGTSHIVRQDLFNLPDKIEDVGREYICKMLGSHTFMHDLLDKQATPLEELPFVGAVYRIGHAGAHSGSQNLMNLFFLRSRMIFRPWLFIARLFRLRYLTEDRKKEFFGV